MATIKSIHPSHVEVGKTTTLTITGEGFSESLIVAFSGRRGSDENVCMADDFTIVSDTTLTVVCPATLFEGRATVIVSVDGDVALMNKSLPEITVA